MVSESTSVTGAAVWERLHLVATFALAALTTVTALAMSRLFDDWGYLPRALGVALGIHLLMLALRALRLPPVAALGVGLAGAVWAVAGVQHLDTTWLGFPTGASVRALQSDITEVWSNFSTAVAPVASVGAFAVIATATLALMVPVVDTLAFGALARAEAVLPMGVVFVFVSALGTPRGRIVYAAVWIGVALFTVAALRSTHRRRTAAWAGGITPRAMHGLTGAAAAATLVALVAALVGPHAPGADRPALVDTRHRGGGDTEIVSPLVDIRSRLVNQSDVLLFTVRSPEARYWRLIGLSDFDGLTWRPEEEPLRARGGGADGRTISTEITIERLGGLLLPAAYLPRVPSGGEFDWAARSEALVANDDALPTGRPIAVRSTIIDIDPSRLVEATALHPPSASLTALPASLPPEVAQLASAVAGDEQGPYGMALALQRWFRSEFTYDLDVRSGHDGHAMLEFLEQRRGYCEQFAATFAAMARSLGLPARVAVGFTPGVQTGVDTYEVHGRQAHAWPEVWFDDIGWVAFEPTPGRGQPGSEAITGLTPQQDAEEPEPSVTPSSVTTPAPTDDAPAGDPGAADPEAQETPEPSATTVPEFADATGPGSRGARGWIGAVLVALMAALAAWPVVMPRVVRARRRRLHARPEEQVTLAWGQAREALDPLIDAPAGATPLEFADRVPERIAPAELVGELASFATAAVYSPRPTSDEDAAEARSLSSQIVDALRADEPLHRRLVDAYDWRRVR